MWVHNLGCEEAQYLDTWQNSDPGILNIVEALFKMPVETLAAAMQVDLSTAQVFVKPYYLSSSTFFTFPQPPNQGLTALNFCTVRSILVYGLALI